MVPTVAGWHMLFVHKSGDKSTFGVPVPHAGEALVIATWLCGSLPEITPEDLEIVEEA